MLPLRDFNPTRRSAVVTFVLIVLNVGVYFLVQQPGRGQEVVPVGDRAVQLPGDLRFNLEFAAIPCEVTQGEPLDLRELERTFDGGDHEACEEPTPGVPELFPEKRVWTAVLFSMFLHGSLLHLGGNMLFLWIFGNNIEDHLGRLRFIVFYVAGGLVSAIAHIAVQPASTVPVVGASGAIAAVMGAYLIWFPRARILALVTFLVLPIQARWLLIFWFVSQFFVNPASGVAWVAHVGGFVFGVAVAMVVRSSDAARHAMWRTTYANAPLPPESGPWRRF